MKTYFKTAISCYKLLLFELDLDVVVMFFFLETTAKFHVSHIKWEFIGWIRFTLQQEAAANLLGVLFPGNNYSFIFITLLASNHNNAVAALLWGEGLIYVYFRTGNNYSCQKLILCNLYWFNSFLAFVVEYFKSIGFWVLLPTFWWRESCHYVSVSNCNSW